MPGSLFIPSGGGAGDVSGPGPLVDHALPRMDGTTGLLLQGYTSGTPTISDTGSLTLADGTNGAPSLAFVGDTGAGLYQAGNAVIVTRGSVPIMLWTSNPLIEVRSDANFTWSSTTGISATPDLNLSRGAAGVLHIGAGTLAAFDASLKFTTLLLQGKAAIYDAITTAGHGVPSIYGYGDVAAATNVGTASIAAYTVGASDGTFEVGANALVTASTTHSFSLDVTYTDESNTARTLILPVAQLAGTFITGGLITNVTGAGPYESATMTIRAKAATAITVRTSATGTFTAVVYNARGTIKQVG